MMNFVELERLSRLQFFGVEHKHSSKYAKIHTKKLVKYLSKCKFYKKYGNTADFTENTVQPSVFPSRKFLIKDHSHHFTSMAYEILYARKVDLWAKRSISRLKLFFVVTHLTQYFVLIFALET
jgi:hypothetical protein